MSKFVSSLKEEEERNIIIAKCSPVSSVIPGSC